jgi:hypothetical protein
MTTEIRYPKLFLRLFVLVLSSVLITSNYVIYLTHSYDDKPYLKYVYILVDLYLIYMLYTNSLRLIKNKPVLILTEESIEINEGKETTRYQWVEINSFRGDRDEHDSKGHYLILETTSSTKRVNLNWLEKTPDQVIELISQYKK